MATCSMTNDQLRKILEPHWKGKSLLKAKKAVLLEKCEELGLELEKLPLPEEPPCSSSQRWIPLRDKTKAVVAWTLVDAIDYDSLMKFSWSVRDGLGKRYAVNNFTKLMHRILLGEPTEDDDVIDHMDGDGLNNTRANLRFATYQLNSQNKIKKGETSSKYYGVSKSPWGWVASHASQGLGYFDTELKAAWAYDEHIRSKYAGKGKVNGVAKPQDYVEYVSRKLTCKSRGVSLKGNEKYMASYWNKLTKSHINLGTYKTEEEASKVYEAYRKEIEAREEQEWLQRPIMRDQNGVAIIPLSVVDGKPQEFTLVDDDIWHFFMKRKWHKDNMGYASALRTRMHAEVLHVPKGFVVDHIIGKLDNRLSNLRQATYGGNVHNRAGNTKCGYKGVYARINLFAASVTFHKTRYDGGLYPNKELAAFAYNCLAKRLYGDGARLNDVVTPEGWAWNSKILRLVKIQT